MQPPPRSRHPPCRPWSTACRRASSQRWGSGAAACDAPCQRSQSLVQSEVKLEEIGHRRFKKWWINEDINIKIIMLVVHFHVHFLAMGVRNSLMTVIQYQSSFQSIFIVTTFVPGVLHLKTQSTQKLTVWCVNPTYCVKNNIQLLILITGDWREMVVTWKKIDDWWLPDIYDVLFLSLETAWPCSGSRYDCEG